MKTTRCLSFSELLIFFELCKSYIQQVLQWKGAKNAACRQTRNPNWCALTYVYTVGLHMKHICKDWAKAEPLLSVIWCNFNKYSFRHLNEYLLNIIFFNSVFPTAGGPEPCLAFPNYLPVSQFHTYRLTVQKCVLMRHWLQILVFSTFLCSDGHLGIWNFLSRSMDQKRIMNDSNLFSHSTLKKLLLCRAHGAIPIKVLELYQLHYYHRKYSGNF